MMVVVVSCCAWARYAPWPIPMPAPGPWPAPVAHAATRAVPGDRRTAPTPGAPCIAAKPRPTIGGAAIATATAVPIATAAKARARRAPRPRGSEPDRARHSRAAR